MFLCHTVEEARDEPEGGGVDRRRRAVRRVQRQRDAQAPQCDREVQTEPIVLEWAQIEPLVARQLGSSLDALLPYVARFERELWHRLASKYGAAAASASDAARLSTAAKQTRGRRQQPDALDTARAEAETQSELSDLQLAWEELVPLLDGHREQLALYVRAASEEAPIELDWSTVLQLVDENRDEVWRHLHEGRLVSHREVQVELLLDWALVQQVRHLSTRSRLAYPNEQYCMLCNVLYSTWRRTSGKCANSCTRTSCRRRRCRWRQCARRASRRPRRLSWS